MILELEVIVLKKTIIISVLFIIGITIFDYDNVPTLLGLNTTNMNWDFYMGLLNIIAVIVVFAITFQTLNQREIKIHEKEIEHEINKYNISLMLLQDCYDECLEFIKVLNDEHVEKYIVPKIDFNSINPIIISNLQSIPFINESYFMDFVKDGQITKRQISGYLQIKRKFKHYVNMRITFFDTPHIYLPLKDELERLLDIEKKEIKNLMQE